MLCVSFLNEDKTLDHTLLTEKFELLNMLPSHVEVKKLIVQQLEQPIVEAQPVTSKVVGEHVASGPTE